MSGDIKELSVEEIEKRIEEQLKKEQEHKNTLDKIINCIPLLLSKRRERYLTYICQNEDWIYFELKKVYPDLVNLNIYNEHSHNDYRSASEESTSEGKGRTEDFDTLLIEKYKWDRLITLPDKNILYVCATPKRVVMFDVKNLPEPNWEVQKHNKTTRFKDNEKIDKVVGFYDVKTQVLIDLTEELFKINNI